MRLVRWGVLVALLGFLGCDVGTATVLLLQDRGKKSASGPESAPAPLGFDQPIFKAWTAKDVMDVGTADAAKTVLIGRDGNPDSNVWQEIGSIPANDFFDPTANPDDINAILIQVSSTQNFALDNIEILDLQNLVVGYASGATWSNLVDFPDNLLGPPDGIAAITTATGATRAFIFVLTTGPVERFRVNGHGVNQPPPPGSVEAAGGFTSASNQRPGGVAVDSNGLIHVTLSVANTITLVRFGLDGSLADQLASPIATGITASAGSHSVALDANDVIYTASTVSNGQILIRQFAAANLAPGWSTTFNSGLGSDRVEANAIAADSTGSLVVVGGINSLTGINHWMARLTASNGGVQWTQSPGLDLTGPTYWHGVTTDSSNLIFATGDLTSALSSQVDVQTARYSTAGANQWQDQFGTGGNPNLGNTVAVAASGKVYVAGFLSTTGQGRNSFIISYVPDLTIPGNPLIFTDFNTYNGSANSNDEILDVAVDSDGFVYAVGYETVSGQGENFWVRKYTSDLNEVWTRTYDGGVGNDRAISVAIFDTHVIVAGFQTVTGGQTKLLLRVYAK